MAGLSIDVSAGPPRVLHLRGELDMATAEELKASLDDQEAADSELLIDMRDVTFVDAAGLRVILQHADRRDGTGPLTLLNAARVARLLELVGLRDEPTLDLRDEPTVDSRPGGSDDR